MLMTCDWTCDSLPHTLHSLWFPFYYLRPTILCSLALFESYVFWIHLGCHHAEGGYSSEAKVGSSIIFWWSGYHLYISFCDRCISACKWEAIGKALSVPVKIYCKCRHRLIVFPLEWRCLMRLLGFLCFAHTVYTFWSLPCELGADINLRPPLKWICHFSCEKLLLLTCICYLNPLFLPRIRAGPEQDRWDRVDA